MGSHHLFVSILGTVMTLDRVAFLYLYLSGGSAGVNVEDRLGFELKCWADTAR